MEITEVSLKHNIQDTIYKENQAFSCIHQGSLELRGWIQSGNRRMRGLIAYLQ